MFTSVLYLSHWNEEKKVYVTDDHLKNLEQHHLDCLRSLYESYNKQFKGKLVTYPEGINITIIIRTLLSAIIKDLKFPVLIVCNFKMICLWHYEISKISNVVVVNYEKSKIDSVVNSPCIIISTLEKLKESPLQMDFSVIIGEDIESLINKVAFKKIANVPFKIGLSKMEFYQDDELKILWHILKWCNPNLYGKLNEFIETHKDHMDNLRDPYDNVWHRIDWDLPDNYESEIDNNEYKFLLDQWNDKNNFISKTTKSGIKSSKRSIGDNKSDKSTSQSKKTKTVTNRTDNFVNEIQLKNSCQKTKSTINLVSFENNNNLIAITTTNNGVKRSIENNVMDKSKHKQQFKKSKSTVINETKNIIEKNPFKNKFPKAKSTNDLDSLKTIFEKDSWVEDFMKDMDVSKLSSECNTSFNVIQENVKEIDNSIETFPFSLFTDLKLFEEFSEDFKVVEEINNLTEDFTKLSPQVTTQKNEETADDAIDDYMEKNPFSLATESKLYKEFSEDFNVVENINNITKGYATKSPSPKETQEDEEIEGIYPILDAVINGNPLKKAMEKYKIMQINSNEIITQCSMEKTQISRKRSPSPILIQRDESVEEYPILDAIIKGSPLKEAMEEYKTNVLGRNDFNDDFFPFSFKTDLNKKF